MLREIHIEPTELDTEYFITWIAFIINNKELIMASGSPELILEVMWLEIKAIRGNWEIYGSTRSGKIKLWVEKLNEVGQLQVSRRQTKQKMSEDGAQALIL